MAAFDGVSEDFEGFLDAFEEGVVFGRASGCAFVWVVTEDLLAVGALDLGIGGAVAVFGEAQDGVVVLSLEWSVSSEGNEKGATRDRRLRISYFPILRISPQYQRIFRLTNAVTVILLNFLDILIGLDALVFGKCSLMTFLLAHISFGLGILLFTCLCLRLDQCRIEETYPPCMSKEMRSHRL